MKISSVIAAVAIAAFSAAFCSCDDDGEKYNPNAKIYINGVDALNKVATTQQRLTVEQICKGDSIRMNTSNNEKLPENFEWSDFGITINSKEEYIDTVNMRLVFPAYDVLGGADGVDNSDYTPENNVFFFGKGRSLYITDGHYATYGDTIGYIPDKVRLEAYDVLMELFKDKDANREKIYDVFTNAFQFIPCTGAEYKAMIERGEQ